MAQTALLSSVKPATAAASELERFREAPHNIEAEQALLGAILVNNEAVDRVSSFLEPHHFYDPLHAQIFEVAAKMIGAGKQATPITLKTFFDAAEPIDANLTVPQYLGRLAANATTIINAEDYGRTVYDLATRRSLITIGEDMVNSAYDAPIDTYVDISETIELKIEALRCHKSQIQDWPVDEWIRERARQRGEAAGIPFAETFRTFKLREEDR